MLLAAAEAVAGQVDVSAPGAPLVPPVSNLRASSATTAVAVAQAAIAEGVATTKPATWCRRSKTRCGSRSTPAEPCDDHELGAEIRPTGWSGSWLIRREPRPGEPPSGCPPRTNPDQPSGGHAP